MEKIFEEGEPRRVVQRIRRYISGVIHAVLESVDSRLSCTVTSIRFTPPTQTVDGEYVYQVTIQFSGRAIALRLTTEPLRMVILAGSAAVSDPAPKSDPVPNSSDEDDDDEDWEETYPITVLKTDGCNILPFYKNFSPKTGIVPLQF